MGTIENDDAAPTLAIDDVIRDEGDAGTTAFTFTVTQSGATALPASVDFATANGTATAPGDYASAQRHADLRRRARRPKTVDRAS